MRCQTEGKCRWLDLSRSHMPLMVVTGHPDHGQRQALLRAQNEGMSCLFSHVIDLSQDRATAAKQNKLLINS
jgi:hypothetical protein